MIINAENVNTDIEKREGDFFKTRFHVFGDVTGVLIINASDDPANRRYINTKSKMIDKYGCRCFVKTFNAEVTTEEIKEYIQNVQGGFTAVMVQKPIYNHLDFEDIMSVVDPKKDIDGLHPYNQGLVYTRHEDALVPCTAVGVIKLLDLHDISMTNKKVVIIGRGPLVADPLSKLLEYRNATVTKIHTRTSPEYTKMLIKHADVIISCVGKDISDMLNPNTVGDNLEALIGVGFRYEFDRQMQDFKVSDNWNDNVKITSNIRATGLATVCGLINNLLQIKKNEVYYDRG